MSLLKKSLFLLLVGSMVILSGCGKGQAVSKELQLTNEAGYLEDDMEFPINAAGFINFETLSSGEILGYFFDKFGNIKTYKLLQNGRWQDEAGEYFSKFSKEPYNLLTVQTLANNNKVVVYAEVGTGEESGEDDDPTFYMDGDTQKYGIAELDAAGNITPIDMPLNEVWANHGAVVDKDGNIFMLNKMGKVNGYDHLGKLIRTYETTAKDFTVVGDKLFALSDDNMYISRIDIASGKEEVQLSCIEKGTGYRLFTDGNSVYLLSSEGIYSLKDSELEEVVGTKRTSFGSLGMSSILGAVGKDQIVLNYFTLDGEVARKYYHYETQVPAIAHQFSLYMLEDNNMIRQSARQYESLHPDTDIEVMIGTDEANGITKDDAIKSLNKLILAGEGPDMMMLDGLNVDNYMTQGIFENMADWFTDKELSECYRPIVEVYKEKDSMYILPTRFKVTGLWTNSELASKLQSVEGLIAYGNTPEGSRLFSGQDPKLLISYLYPFVADKLFSEEGTLNEAAFTTFLESIKNMANVDEAIQPSPVDNQMLFSQEYFCQMIALAYGEKKAAMTRIGSLQELLIANEAMKHINGKFNLLKADQKAYFTPTGMLGVNKQTKQMESCKQFVKEMMGIEQQKRDSDIGFPVNKLATAELIKVPEANELTMYYRISDAQMRTLDFHIEKSELIDDYVALGEQVDTLQRVDGQILELILQESADYFIDKQNISDTISRINSKAKLYLLE